MKFQVILKNGKNGSKLFKSVNDVFKLYTAKEVKAINQIMDEDFDEVKTGNRNKKGRQFAMRAGI